MKTIASRVYMVIMDGEDHHASELMPFLVPAVAPQVAVRNYDRARSYRGKRDKDRPAFDTESVPVERKIVVGSRRAVLDLLYSMRARGIVEIVRNREGKTTRAVHGDPANDDFVVRLTDLGRKKLFAPPPNNVSLGYCLGELRRLLVRGAITVHVTINNGGHDPAPEE